MVAEPQMNAKYLAEFVGTFLLVFTVGCNVLSGQPVWGGVSIGCVLMVCIYALGSISGANFNPAVSVSLALSKAAGGPGIDCKQAGMYCGVQIFAGMLAAMMYSELFWKTFNLAPAKPYSFFQAGLVEMLYTCMLCFVVLNVAVAKKNTPNHFFGLAIGFVVVAGAYGAGAISGGCFNPAVAFGIDSSSMMIGFGWCIAYTFFELLGAALAVGLYMAVRPSDFDRQEGGSAQLISEFVGTFFLVLTVGLNVLAGSQAGAFSIAASLMCMVYSLGDVSGAHFNPAVTAAIFLSDRCKDTLTPTKAGLYMLAQLAGGIVAAFTYSFIHNGKSFPLGPQANFGWVEVALAEAAFTFVLAYVVLCVAVSRATKADVMFGLAIGSCVTVGGSAIGKISLGSLNPAVSFGIAASNMPVRGVASLASALAYTGFELAGAGLAAGVFKATHSVDLGEEEPLKP